MPNQHAQPVTLGLPVLRTLVALLASFSQISLANLSTPATQGTRDLGTRPYALVSLLFDSGPSPNQFIRRLKNWAWVALEPNGSGQAICVLWAVYTPADLDPKCSGEPPSW
jgi:hypothetical protein